MTSDLVMVNFFLSVRDAVHWRSSLPLFFRHNGSKLFYSCFFVNLALYLCVKQLKSNLLVCYWWILMIVMSDRWIVPLMSVRDVAIRFELGSWLEVTIHICQQVLVSDLINSYLLPIKLHLTVRTQRRVRTNSRNCLSVRDVFFFRNQAKNSYWRFPAFPRCFSQST